MTPKTLTVEQIERMSGQVLRSTNGATPAPEDLRAALTEQLGLDVVHLAVTSVEVFGRGQGARVDVHLKGANKPLRFDRYGDIAKPSTLTAELMSQLGVGRSFKGPDAVAVGVTIFQLARHHEAADEDEAAREWACEYLRVAPVQETDLSDQVDRWRGFEALSRLEPSRLAGDDKSAAAIAAHSLVLADRESGQRLVRAGWFQAYVKREVGGVYSPATLATQMQRVGWQRSNSEGRIKATSPTSGRILAWRFYTVPAGWEDDQVPAGSQPYTRTHTRTRGVVDTPAGTGNPSNGHHEGVNSGSNGVSQ